MTSVLDLLKRTLDASRNERREPKHTLAPRATNLRILQDYATGEQFRDGVYWRGRIPAGAEYDEVKRVFNQDDLIGPAIQAVVDGILSKDPDWAALHGPTNTTSAALLAPNAATNTTEDLDIAEGLQALEKNMRAWHHDAALLEALRDAKYDEQWAGVSSLRIYIPDAYEYLDPYDPTTPLTANSLDTLEDALERIHIMSVDALTGGPILDEHDREVGHYYQYSLPRDDDALITDDYVEVHTPQWVTHYRASGSTLEEVRRDPNPLFDPKRIRRPRYLMTTLRRARGTVITASVRDAQDHLNEVLTDMRRNGQLAGAPQWVFKNVEPTDQPESTDEYATGLPQPGRGSPDDVLPTGAGTVWELVGRAIRDELGNIVGYAAPEADRLDPVNPEENLLPEAKAYRSSLLRHFDRLWTEGALLSVSGVSRQEARKSWDNRIIAEAMSVARAISWALLTTAHLATTLVRDSAKPNLDGVTFMPKLFLDVSPADLEAYRALLEGKDRAAVSLETLVMNMPVDGVDVDAELKRLKAEPTPSVLPGINAPDMPRADTPPPPPASMPE